MIVTDYIKDNTDDAEKEFLEECLTEAGFNIKQCLYINAVNCNPISIPKKNEVNNCKLYLNYAIDAFRPICIIAVGNIAYNSLREGILNREHGKIFYLRDNIPMIGIYSPSMIESIQEEELADQMIEEVNDDLKKIKKIVENNYSTSDLVNN